jgi:hypothetical protein
VPERLQYSDGLSVKPWDETVLCDKADIRLQPPKDLELLAFPQS